MLPDAQGLYDPANEADSCGVAMVTDIQGQRSHDRAQGGLGIGLTGTAGAFPVFLALAAGIGVISAFYLKDPTDPQWQNSQEYKDWMAWMQKYFPGGDVKDNLNVVGAR